MAEEAKQVPAIAEKAPTPDPVPDSAPAPASGDTFQSSISESASNVASSLRENAGYIIIGLLGVAGFAFVVAFVLYWLINSYVISKRVVAIPDTKIPKPGNVVTKISGVASPVGVNGKRYTITFWVYVHDFDKYRGSMRHVLHIGDEDVASGSPFVFFGPNDNKMYVGFNPNTPFDHRATDQLGKCNELLSKHGIAIDYVPAQRWVHVAIVVNEETNGGIIVAYLDAEVVKTAANNGSGTTSANTPVTSTLELYNLNLNKAGSLVIGGSTSDAIGPGFSGLVSNVRLFNHDLNIQDVYNDYLSGPIDNLLAKLGLPAYGVRSPVYKL